MRKLLDEQLAALASHAHRRESQNPSDVTTGITNVINDKHITITDGSTAAAGGVDVILIALLVVSKGGLLGRCCLETRFSLAFPRH